MPQPRASLEKTALKLGFIALADCAPLVAASELGFFADEGLDVCLKRQGSWAAIRDKVALGALDGAQMLAGLPLAATLGLGTAPQPMVTALSLSLNGNSITVSDALYRRMRAHAPDRVDRRDAGALRAVLEADRDKGLAPLTFAMVHPVSSHNYQLRYWLASAGIDPDRDVRLIVVPPARMVANLEAGRIAGFCVGAPWSEIAVARGLGGVPITGYELWNNAPEKVLGVARGWAEAYPNTHRALLRALIRACIWLDTPGNRQRIAATVARPAYVACDADLLAAIYAGQLKRHADAEPMICRDHCVFHRYQANFPWRSHALWFMHQMQRWNQLHPATDIAAAAIDVYRPEIYREVAATLDLIAPDFDGKAEGRHDAPWQPGDDAHLTLGADRFFDGGGFDPDPAAAAPLSRLAHPKGETS